MKSSIRVVRVGQRRGEAVHWRPGMREAGRANVDVAVSTVPTVGVFVNAFGATRIITRVILLAETKKAHTAFALA